MKNETLKSNRVLQVILAAFLIIAFRVWHLQVIQREEKQNLAERPKRRVIVEKADRGTLCDRFSIPLAVNRICYNAAIYYNQISQIPAISWKSDKKIKTYPRREYIAKLSQELGAILHLDPGRVEDLIYSKASLFPHVPFLLKTHLTEEEHYRLALLEKDWLGIHAEIASERFYPRGKAGASLIGSMGSISSKEYWAIAEELSMLEKMVEEWEQGQGVALPAGYSSFEAAVRRLQELREKAYAIQDLVGKSGIEGQFEQLLRGFYGKKIFEIDQKGRSLRGLPRGKEAIPGQQITLSLSIELQEFAEGLLAQDEAWRESRTLATDPTTKEKKTLKQPWIRGGAIVALDPKTGEVIALASTPRFDSNDFIPSSNPVIQSAKQRNIHRWLESDRFIGSIWDGKEELSREHFTPAKGFSEERVPLTWERFLEMIVPFEGVWKTFFQRVDDVKIAVQVQEDFEALLHFSSVRDPSLLLEEIYSGLWQAKSPEAAAAWKRLDPLLTPLLSNGDRLLAVDLCRLVVHAPAMSDGALKILGPVKLSQYRTFNQTLCRLEAELKEKARAAFSQHEFKSWREVHQKSFLAEIRKREKQESLSPRPYLDYLDQKERELFEEVWREQRLSALAAALPDNELKQLCKSLPEEEVKSILHSFRSFPELQRPLLGGYRGLRKKKGEQTERELAMAFYPVGGFGQSRSYAFQTSGPQGSLFKLVTAYAALAQTGGSNPLTLIDEVKQNGRTQTVATSLSGVPYPRIYKGGRLPKTSSFNVGKIDLIGALERSSNSYFSILAGDVLRDPEDLNIAAHLFGFGERTGIDLLGEARGFLPTDLSENRTGLYSAAIGQHTLLTTPLQSARMVAAIANGGKLLKPILAKKITGPMPDHEPLNAFEATAMQEEFRYLGLSFPLFTAALRPLEKSHSNIQEPQLIRTLELPNSIRSPLLEGMDRVVWSAQGNSRPGIIRKLQANPALIPSYLALRHRLLAKTGTAEILFNPFINPSSAAQMCKHIWFGSIAFPSEKWEDPELVVIVYLRYGDSGRECAPLAAQLINKWHELKQKHQKNYQHCRLSTSDLEK
ncbi:MAG: hypothetical protein KGJ02_01715 [Verrucomicrobiota bacterium]|nr:hypothetical protein [Verrucomicrobiota bacterium]